MKKIALLYLLTLYSLTLCFVGIAEVPHTESEIPEKFRKRTSYKKPNNPDGFKTMGKDIQKFGEEVAQRIDRLVKKKTFELNGDPWTMQGLPILFPSSADGFNIGVRLQLQDIRRQDPHQMEIIAQLMGSDKGRYKHQLQLDLPYAFGGQFRFVTRLSYDRDISIHYFGTGNNPPFNSDLLSNGSPLYTTVLSGVMWNFQLYRRFGRYYRAGPVMGFRWMNIGAPVGSLLESQPPVGVSGGQTHYLGLAVVRDTLDFEPYPSRGDYNELFFQYYGPITGSNYEFTRLTYTFRYFYPLHRRLTFAHRTMLESLAGNVPFYEMFTVGGTQWGLVFGGDRFFRGYDSNRFLDKLRLVFGFELRWDPLFTTVMKQDLTIGFVPFFDFGRVWDKAWPLDLNVWHASAGWGLRLIWNSRLVFRIDTAIQPEGLRASLNLNNAF